MSPPAGRKASPQFTIAEMLDMEREHLMAMPEAFDGYVEHPSRVSSTCLVSVARNRYIVAFTVIRCRVNGPASA